MGLPHSTTGDVNAVKHLTVCCLAPQISTSSYNEEIAYKMELHVEKHA